MTRQVAKKAADNLVDTNKDKAEKLPFSIPSLSHSLDFFSHSLVLLLPLYLLHLSISPPKILFLTEGKFFPASARVKNQVPPQLKHTQTHPMDNFVVPRSLLLPSLSWVTPIF